MNKTKKLYAIDSKSWEHPADRAALSALKGLKGLDDIIKFVFGKTNEQSIRLIHLASSARVSPTQFPSINASMDRIMDVFDWPYRPEVFVSQSPIFNAGTYGVDKPFIVLNSSIAANLTDDELACVLAHEMGHVMSGHALYKTLLWLLVNISEKLFSMSELVLLPIIAALREWDKKSELTADRAGLLALQNEAVSYTILMKSAAGYDASQLNINDFFAQASEYENNKDILSNINKALATVWESHPFPVVRLKELHTWFSSGEYSAIMEGNYIKRGFSEASPSDDIKQGYEFYKKEFDSADDPISNAAKVITSGLSKIGEDIEAAIKSLLP